MADAPLFDALAFPNEKRPTTAGSRAGQMCTTCQKPMLMTSNWLTGVRSPLAKKENPDPFYFVFLENSVPPERVQLMQADEIIAVTAHQLMAVTDFIQLTNGFRIPRRLLDNRWLGRTLHHRVCSNPEAHKHRR